MADTIRDAQDAAEAANEAAARATEAQQAQQTAQASASDIIVNDKRKFMPDGSLRAGTETAEKEVAKDTAETGFFSKAVSVVRNKLPNWLGGTTAEAAATEGAAEAGGALAGAEAGAEGGSLLGPVGIAVGAIAVGGTTWAAHHWHWFGWGKPDPTPAKQTTTVNATTKTTDEKKPKEVPFKSTPELDSRYNLAKKLARALGGPNGPKIADGLTDDIKDLLGLDGSPDQLKKFKGLPANKDDAAAWADVFKNKPDAAKSIQALADALKDNDMRGDVNDALQKARSAAKVAADQKANGQTANAPGSTGAGPVTHTPGAPTGVMVSLTSELMGMVGQPNMLNALGKLLSGYPQTANDADMQRMMSVLNMQPKSDADKADQAAMVLNMIDGMKPDQIGSLKAFADRITQTQQQNPQQQNTQNQNSPAVQAEIERRTQLYQKQMQGINQQQQRENALETAVGKQIANTSTALEALILSKAKSSRLSLNPVNWFNPDHAYKSEVKQLQKAAAGDAQGFAELKGVMDQIHAQPKGKASVGSVEQNIDSLNNVFLKSIRQPDGSYRIEGAHPLIDGVDSVLNTQKDVKMHVGTIQQAEENVLRTNGYQQPFNGANEGVGAQLKNTAQWSPNAGRAAPGVIPQNEAQQQADALANAGTVPPGQQVVVNQLGGQTLVAPQYVPPSQ